MERFRAKRAAANAVGYPETACTNRSHTGLTARANDYRTPMPLVLIVPGLLALGRERLAASRSLAVLAGYAQAPRREPRGIAAAMLAALGIAGDTPIAPLAMLGAGADPGDDYILRADPVQLAADRDTVVLVQGIEDLSDADAHALVGTLNAHFAQDDLRFEAPRPDAWFARRAQAADIVTTPLDAALRRSLLASLPRGGDAGRWKRWQNEIEMLLHAHAVNSARESRGEPAASGLWFSDGGRLRDVGALPRTSVTAAPGRVADVARGIAVRGGGCAVTLRAGDGLGEALARAGAVAAGEPGRGAVAALAVLPAPADDAALLEERWLAPALERLARRDIDRLHLIADGNGVAATWTAQPPGLRQRIAARIARPRFEVPRDVAA